MGLQRNLFRSAVPVLLELIQPQLHRATPRRGLAAWPNDGRLVLKRNGQSKLRRVLVQPVREVCALEGGLGHERAWRKR